jgi:hypothetical protein
MKVDPYLGASTLVRRNFQGTTFAISESNYTRIKEILAKLQLG